jgi:hypothetical protein
VPEWRPPVELTALGAYLEEINRTMEAHGFGRNPQLPVQVAEPKEPTPSWESLNEARVQPDQENRGLFLIHDWTPSTEEGQAAEVVIRLCEHGKGPVSRGEVRVVAYSLGAEIHEPLAGVHISGGRLRDPCVDVGTDALPCEGLLHGQQAAFHS